MLRRPEDPNKRKLQMTPMQSPQPTAPQETESTMQRFSKLALDKGMNTAVDEGGKMFTKYVKPMFTPQVVPTTEAAIAADPILLAGGIPAELTTGIMTGGAKAATGTGLMSSLGGMGTAAMASPLAPILGGFALAKMFGLFSGGGQVGPLSAAQYKSSGGDVYKLSYGGGPLTKGE